MSELQVGLSVGVGERPLAAPSAELSKTRATEKRLQHLDERTAALLHRPQLKPGLEIHGVVSVDRIDHCARLLDLLADLVRINHHSRPRSSCIV